MVAATTCARLVPCSHRHSCDSSRQESHDASRGAFAVLLPALSILEGTTALVLSLHPCREAWLNTVATPDQTCACKAVPRHAAAHLPTILDVMLTFRLERCQASACSRPAGAQIPWLSQAHANTFLLTVREHAAGGQAGLCARLVQSSQGAQRERSPGSQAGLRGCRCVGGGGARPGGCRPWVNHGCALLMERRL